MAANHFFFTTTATTDAWGDKVVSHRCNCGWGSVALRDVERVDRALEIHLEGVEQRGGVVLRAA